MKLDSGSSIDGALLWSVPPPDLLPRSGEIQVFAFATDLPPPRMAAIEPLLALDERARASRFRFERDRGRFVAARGLLRTILAWATGRPPAELEFDCGPFGKPALRPGRGGDRIRFNLSRSHGLGLVAIGLDEEVGVDIERTRPFDEALAIAEQMFTDQEHGALRSLPDEERPGSFFNYWVRKEAVVKSLGRGLSYPLDGFGLSPGGTTPECLAVDCHGLRAVRWVLPVPPPCDSFVAALATAGPRPTVRCWAWPGE